MKVRTHTNAWGNTYGYIGTRKAAAFSGSDREQVAQAAQWERDVNGLTDAQRRDMCEIYRLTGQTYGRQYVELPDASHAAADGRMQAGSLRTQ
jgi:hypothetical protein